MSLTTALPLPRESLVRRASRRNNGSVNREQLEAFGARVRRRREALDLTRSALCDLAGITRTTLRHLENGWQHPSPQTLERLVVALQTTEDLLVGTTTIAPDNPLLANLSEEDLEVAQTFHHAPTRVKQRVLDVLQERGRKAEFSDAAELWRRFEQLDPAQRHQVSVVIEEMAQRTSAPAAGASSTTSPATAPVHPKAGRR